MKPKVYILFILPLIVLTLALSAVAFWWVDSLKSPNSTFLQKQSFIIQKGETGAAIAKDLKSQGLVKNDLVFRIYLRIKNITKSLPPGEYELSPSQNLQSIVATLSKGPIGVWVTVPEGVRREQIAERIIESFELSGDKAKTFYDEFLKETEGQEGYLFPDTYIFLKSSSVTNIVAKLKSTFDQKTQNLNITTGLSLRQTVILASIVERETGKFEENPFVAGILLNRLNAGWPLQADATVQYILGTPQKWWPNVLSEDLKIKSSYNTYTFAGLPIAPIANPGLNALEAAANPKDTPYWYYLHDSGGQIHYAKTLEEHNANIAKYLQ
ncbi:MAG: endolytic transglycosylase MltG [Candidatus Woesebacteria bacterium]|nr:MAG: endolytic transglycosylase MltG [Candidatus Woesebacteria bacterium]